MTNETIGRRRRKERNFVTIENAMFEDNRLSWKAKGLLGYLLTKPDGWVVRVPDLVKHAKDGEKAVRSAIKELKKYGYLTFKRVKNDNGKWAGTVWEYDDVPFLDEEPEKEPKEEPETPQTRDTQGIEPRADFRHVDNRHAEKGTYISNKDFSNKDFREEEDIIINKDAYTEFVQEYKSIIDDKTFNRIREQMIEQGIDFFTVNEANKQIKRMNEKKEPVFDWAKYFVGGIIKNRVSDTQAKAEREATKKRKELEQKEAEQPKRDTSFYYNWLEEA